MTAVSDTSPLRYLIAVGRADLMRDIFGRVLIPRGVEQELTDPAAPETVRQWIEHRPTWLEIRDLPQPPDLELTRRLDRGEAEAIRLAMDLRADFLLMDERRGRQMATARGIIVIGVLGILLESYRRRRIQHPFDILAELRASRFRVSRRLVQEFEEQIRLMKSHE
jgi:predicted nucleic acid-binding protein